MGREPASGLDPLVTTVTVTVPLMNIVGTQGVIDRRDDDPSRGSQQLTAA